MKTPSFTTRASLADTASHNARWFAGLLVGTAVLGSSSVLAGTWTGTASTDWNNSAGNWSGGNGGTVQVNTTPTNIATITANFTTIPTTIIVGNNASGNGRVNHLSGTGTVAAGNDVLIGRAGGIGTYNLANTAAGGGTLTTFGQGSGSLTIPDQFLVGGAVSGVSTGNLNIHTTGTLSVGTEFLIGNLGGTGTVKMDSGTMTVGDAFQVGNGPGAIGTLSLSGGTITKTGAATAVTIGGGLAANGGAGTANLTGGTFTSAGIFRIGHNPLAAGAINATGTLTLNGGTLVTNNEFWVGNNTGATGNFTFLTGTLNQNGAVAIGRKDTANVGTGGTGTVTMSSGTWTKTGTGNFVIGASGNGSMTMSGGLVSVAGPGTTSIGEGNNCTGALTLSGTAEFRTVSFTLGSQGGTTGNLVLNGGTLKTSAITGAGGTSTVDFNGTQIIATGDSASFLQFVTTATIGAGGLLMDTAGFTLTGPQTLTGAGGVVKSGAGTLVLTGASDYTGTQTVTAGKLALSSDFIGTGAVAVANGAAFGVFQISDSSTLALPTVTLGTSGAAALDIDLGNSNGNPTAPALNVSGTLTLNGPITVNIDDADPELGSFPVITYTAPKSGGGNFVLGTLPDGVMGNLTDDGNGIVTLEFESITFPRWTGSQNGNWDTTTPNWVDIPTTNPINYADPLPVVFNDSATGPTAITLNLTVAPANVSFDNSTAIYSLSGTGKITGPTGLTKQGGANLTLDTANDYTGPTTLSGGMTFVNSLANGGSPSSIGASSPIPANFVLAGGSLTYTGPNATSNRGLTINGSGTIIATANNLTFGGQVAMQNGNLIKNGAGDLTFSHNGANVLSTGNQVSLIQAGTLTLSGAGAQTNTATGELWVANLPDSPAHLVLNNTSLVTTSWLAIGRGNGDNGVTNVTATNSTITTVNFSTGFNNGLPNNASEAFVTLNNTVWTNNGLTYLAESTGSAATFTMNGSSQYNINNNFLLARFGGTTATFTMNGTSSITKTGGYVAIGNEGVTVMNMNDSSSFTATNGDYNIGDVGSSDGTLNLAGSATVTVTNVYIGKNSGTTGTLNQTGGAFVSSNFITIGAFGGGTGTVNLSGGALTAGTFLNVGGAGNGTLNLSGTGTATANGDGVLVAATSGGSGTLNLNGGTVNAKRVSQTSGANGTVNFNGGLLKATAGANVTFVGPLNTAAILSGGAFIDTNGQNLSVTAALTGIGGLTKSGAGTLTLSGTYSYGGATTVSTGTLSLPTASLADSSTVSIASGASLNLTHGTTDQIAGLVIAGTPLAAGSYVAGTQAGITGSGTLVVTGVAASPYDTWATSFGLNPLTDGAPTFDKDKDGDPNSVEFALGGSPISGSSRAKTFAIIADSSDGDALKELLLTIAVRSGTPVFSGTPSPSATKDGYTYTIQGGTALSTFPTLVNTVTTVVPPAPNATPPAGYEYRTFSLSTSNGTLNKGFLRVNVTP